MKLRRHFFLMVTVALFLVVSSGILAAGVRAGQTPTQEAEPVTVALNLKDISFEPSVLVIPADQDVIIRLENTGAALHSFVVPDLGIDVELESGESAEVTINAPAGEYAFICTVPGHELVGMAGTLRIMTPTELEAEPAGTPSLSARDLLPEAKDLDGNWTLVEEGERSDTELAEALGEEGEELLLAWGWQENVYRDFARENSAQFLDEATFVSVSIHGFADGDGAASALQGFSQQVVDVQNLKEIPVDDLGFNARVLSGPGDGVNITVVYVQAGNFLIRVGASSELGDPSEMAVGVAKLVLWTIAAATPTTLPATPAGAHPVDLQDDTTCAAIDAYVTELQERAGAEMEAKNVAELAAYGDSEIAQSDLPELADAMDSLANALVAIDPPQNVKAFHDAYIAYLQEYAHQLRTNTSGGGDPYAFMVLLLMFGMPEVDLAYEQMSQEASAAIENCPAFQQAYDLLEPELFLSDAASPIALPLVDTAGCATIDGYLAALEAQAGDDVRNASAALRDFFGDEVFLADIVKAFDDAAISLQAVEPPAIAKDYHQAQIAKLRAYAEIVRAGIARGDRTIFRMFYAMQVEPDVREAFRIIAQHGDHITGTCPAFSDVQAFFDSEALGIDTASPTPLPTVDPSTPTAAFTVIGAELDEADRDRWRVDIEVANGSEGEQAYACAQAVFDYLAKKEAPVVTVFGYAPGDLSDGPFTVCRATGSLDGKGWTGNGETVLGLPDDKQIQVEMGTSLGQENSIYAFDVTELAARSASTRPATPVP